MRWLLLPGLCAAAPEAVPEGAGVPAPAVSEADRQEIFDRFSHRRHEDILEQRGVACIACHQVGTTGDSRVSIAALEPIARPPPGKACHFCHNPESGEPTGTARCILCHDRVEPPESHGAGWIGLHGTEARLQTWSCDSCHRKSFCVDCHERKEDATFQVHDRAWLSVHGIAARTDPAACGICHLQVDCVTCHTTTDGRLR